MSDVPLRRHALLSDCGSAALVTDSGSVDWLSLRRFDNAPVFARLLDDEAGHFLIAPAERAPGETDFAASWRYRPSTLVLDTTWTSLEAELVVTDALALGPRERGHGLGRSAPDVLLRQVRCTRGSVSVRVEYSPRPEYGLIFPRLTSTPTGFVADGGASTLVLSTRAPLQIVGAVTRPFDDRTDARRALAARRAERV